MNYISLLSTLITFIFAVAVFNRYLQKKGTHLLLWGIGLVLYGLGTLSEVILSFSFNIWVLKVWYLAGAMLTAAWLGQGTVFLLVRKRGVAQALLIVLLAVSITAIIFVLFAPVNAVAATNYDVSKLASEQYQEILERSGFIILTTILLNIYGTLTLVGGAIYSAYLFWRKRVLFNRMVGNILIATGALMPALGGTFLQAGIVDFLYLSELIGVVLMYAGFVQATAARPVESKMPA